MLPILTVRPELRCQAHSRRSGWQQCGRLAAYGSRVCTSHGARKTPRGGADAPNHRHGERSLETTLKATHSLQKVRVLAVGVQAVNGDPAAAMAFSMAWPVLMEQQAQELVELRERMNRGRARRKD